MMRMLRLAATAPMLTVLVAAPAGAAECFGDANYRVCTETYTDAQGNIQIRSWDSMGNSYSVNTESYVSPNGDTHIRSYDSEGNSYSVESWSDSSGIHSMDSEGNHCTITPTGEMIGC